MKSAQNAAGSATAENEKYLNSIQGHINSLKVAFETLSKNAVDSDLVKSIVKLGTGLIEIINFVAKLIDKINGLRAVIGLVIALKPHIAVAVLTAPLKGLKTVITELGKSVKELPNAIGSGEKAWERFGRAATTVAGILYTIYSIWKAYDEAQSAKIAESEEAKRQEMEETSRKAQEAARTAAESSSEIANAYVRYDDAKKAVESLTGSTSDFINSRDELIKALGIEGSELDRLVEKYQNYDEALKQVSADKLKQAELDLRRGLNDSGSAGAFNSDIYEMTPDYKAWQDDMAEADKAWKIISEGADFYSKEFDTYIRGIEYDLDHILSFKQPEKGVSRVDPKLRIDEPSQELVDAYGDAAQAVQAYNTYKELLLTMNKAGLDESNAVYKDVSDAYYNISDSVESYFGQLDALNDNLAAQLLIQQDISNTVPKTKKEFDDLRDGLIDAAVTSGKFEGSMQDIEDAIDRVLASKSAFKDYTGIVAAEAADVSDLSEVAERLKSEHALLDKAQEEMSSGKGLSAETIKSLAEAKSDYLDYLYEENGIIKLNTEAWKEYANAEMQSNIGFINDQISALTSERERLEAERLELVDKMNGMPDGLGKYDYQSQINIINRALEENTRAITEHQSKLALYSGLFESIAGKTDAYSTALDNFSNVHTFINTMSDSLTTIANLQEAVANGFTVSLDKALEFASVYPEILNKATVSADGQISLNQDVVNSFISGKHKEFQASIDAKINELEGEKEANTAKMQLAQTELEMVKAVADGKSEITYQVAKDRIEKGQIVAEALIAMGVDEATSYKAVAESMANNTQEFDRITADVCRDVDGNFNNAAKSAADAIYANMYNASVSVDGLTETAHNAALAIAGLASGIVDGITGAFDGIAGMFGGGAYITTSGGNFSGVDPEVVNPTAELEKLINSLEVDISSYQNAIFQLDGQIAALKALRNAPLGSLTTSNKNGGSGGNAGNGGSGGGGSSGGSESEEPENWFEQQYKLHKHLVAMDAEEAEDFLKWLNEAYKRAYDEQIITIDDYRKYCEEVYAGLQNLFKDYLSDVEHEISMRENYDGESKKIIELYKTLISKVESEIAAARQRGLDDDDDYIQDLQNKWQNYTKAIEDLEKEIADSAMNALDKLIEYRINMIKKDIDNEKNALKEKLDALKEFYDKQKKMLQEQAEEEKYLDEQSEKRKSVADIREKLSQLEFDNSAWAQKRKIELQKELSDAQKTLDEFEKDHALDLALDTLDNAYEAQESEINKQIGALEDLLNDPQTLYNQALADIRENSKNQLYYQMLMYNRQSGDGKDGTVLTLWEDAYAALEKYEALFGKAFEGVKLANETGYKPRKESWDSEKISGKGHATVPVNNDNPSLPDGSMITVKNTATNFSARSNGEKLDSSIPGGQYTVYKTDGNEVLIGKNGTYIGWIRKSDIEGYASGTRFASAGLHEIDELGGETLFTSSDGRKFRMFSSGEKVLNAKASNFLYDFANNGSILEKLIKSVSGGTERTIAPVGNTEIRMGDIIVQGTADGKTVSEIRRAQRENVAFMLREFTKLQR